MHPLARAALGGNRVAADSPRLTAARPRLRGHRPRGLAVPPSHLRKTNTLLAQSRTSLPRVDFHFLSNVLLPTCSPSNTPLLRHRLKVPSVNSCLWTTCL